MTGSADERIATIAAAQEGRLSRGQLLAAGLSHHEITWRFGQGLLVPCARGVYAVGHADPTNHSTEIEALLTRPIGALVCGHRAAGVYGFRALPDGVDLLVPSSQGGGHRDGIRIHRTARAEHMQPAFPDGIPTVSAALALLQIAADLTTRALEVAIEDAFEVGCVTRDELAVVVGDNPTAPGVGTLSKLLKRRLVGNPSGSPLQERALAVLRSAGLPDPEMDARIGGGFTADMFWRGARVAVECDSFRWHRTRAAWERDRRKDAYCEAHAIKLVRMVEEDLEGDRLLRLVVKLAASITGRTVAEQARLGQAAIPAPATSDIDGGPV